MLKTDPWGNKIPIMDIQRKEDADDFLRRHRDVIGQVLPINRQTLMFQWSWRRTANH